MTSYGKAAKVARESLSRRIDREEIKKAWAGKIDPNAKAPYQVLVGRRGVVR